MPESPKFSRVEADQILRRAAVLEGSDDPRPITARELRAIASEAGFSADAVDRAIAEAREAGGASPKAPPVQQWGLLVTRLSTLRQLPVEIDSDELLQAVRLFQPYRDGPAHLGLEEHEISWRDRRGIRFAVSSGGGMTEIRVYLSKVTLRRRRLRRWVKAAADRLEDLVRLVAAQNARADRLPAPSPSDREEGG